MSERPKHTTLPWILGDRLDAQGNLRGISVLGGLGAVVVCDLPDGATVEGDDAWPLQRANAELIMRACNCHEELVRLVKAARRREIELSEGESPLIGRDAALVAQYEAAIAKATK